MGNVFMKEEVDPYAGFELMPLERVVFQDHPEFRPDLTPPTMLRLGVFDGYYFRGDTSLIEDLPEEWFAEARWTYSPDPSVNAFGVSVAAPPEFWADRGMIQPSDPLGWFQWYCRFYAGRRIKEFDHVQIARWASARERLSRHVRTAVRPTEFLGRRQELLHWACDPYPDARGRDG